MRVVMIHAVAESIPPVRLAFQDEFPEAEVVNLLDEGLLLDFDDEVTPNLRRRMSELICYSQDHNADARRPGLLRLRAGGGQRPRFGGRTVGVVLRTRDAGGGGRRHQSRSHRFQLGPPCETRNTT